MRRLALIGILFIGGKMALNAPFAFLLLAAFFIGSMEWIERVGEPGKKT